MNWLAFVAGAVLSWGVYGAMLHQGQVKLGSPMRALLCVGVAYFLVGVRRAGDHAVRAGPGPARVQQRRHHGGDRRRHARGARRRLHHLLVPHRRHADLRDAAGVRRRAARQRPLHDGHAPAEDRARARCSTSASWSPPSAPAWCCISSLRRENSTCRRARAGCTVTCTCGGSCHVRRAVCECHVRNGRPAWGM